MNNLFLYRLKFFKVAVIFFVAAISISPAFGQTPTGQISGKVVDAQNGEPIIGANIGIVGTALGDATDLNGTYTIQDIPEGIYSLSVSYISYGRKTVTEVEVIANEATTLNVTLQPQTVGLDEVTVTTQASSNSVAGLLSIQKKAIPVQDGLSSEFLEKTGDGNVASAIKRIPGVTLLNGNEVYVRGLGNRYSNVQLNGASVPSTSPVRKKAPIDLVGTGLIDNIVVQKTYTPDLSGEFSGGSVKITTSEFPNSRQLSFSYSTSVNSRSFAENMLGTTNNSFGFFGYDADKRQLPSLLKSQRLILGEAEGQVAHALHRDWVIGSKKQVIPSQKFGLSYADQFNQSSLPIGLVSNFSYEYDRDIEPSVTLREIQSAAQNNRYTLNSDYKSSQGVENLKVGGMLNLFLKPGDTTKIGLKNLYSNSVVNSAQIINGSYINYSSPIRQTVQNFEQRAVFSSALDFETYFSDFYNSRLSANLNYSRAYLDRPDRRTTQYNRVNGGDYHIYFDDGGINHSFFKQNDNNYSGELNYEIDPFNFLSIKAGGTMLFKNRDFSSRRLEYQDFRGAFPNALRNATPDVALHPDVIESNKLDLVEITQNEDSYQGTQQLWAAYLSTIWTPLPRTTLELGARIEDSDQEVSIINTQDVTEQISNVESLDILPAVNVAYSVNDKTNLRGAFSITLARPEFREISEFRFQDFVGGQIIYGNPDLEQTQIHNYDLRFETYPNIGEMFAVSLFYKQFSNPIEMVYRLSERTEVQYKNGKEAHLLGIEVEARKNITPRLQMVANGSYIFSETTVKDADRFKVANISRPMFGQSPFTFNLSAFYSIPAWNLDLSAAYNTFGKRIVTVGMQRHPGDEYEMPFHNLSFNADYKLGSISLSLGIENILNDDRVYKQGDTVTYRYNPGMTVDLGIKLSL